MILVNRVGELISGSVNGKQFSVTYDEQKYAEMIRLREASEKASTMDELKAIVIEFLPLTEESFKELVETKCQYIFVNKSTNKYYLKYNEKISKNHLPQVFVEKILTSVEAGADINPLIKCWVRFIGNDNYTDKKAAKFAEYINAPYVNKDLVKELMDKGMSYEVATEHATGPQVAITMEGLLVCYKVSREVLHKYALDEDGETRVTKSRYGKTIDEDTGEISTETPEYDEDRLFEPAVQRQNGDAFHCLVDGQDKLGHFIKVGGIHYLDSWDQVDRNDEHTCVKGLHVGGLRYIEGYQNEGTVTHNILVDPRDIGAIVGLGYGNDGAMRVRRYMVFSTFRGANRNIYHYSKYAAFTDAEYAVAVQEAIKKTESMKAAIDEEAQTKAAFTV